MRAKYGGRDPTANYSEVVIRGEEESEGGCGDSIVRRRAREGVGTR